MTAGRYQQWPLGKPVPWGWVIASETTVSGHSVLIKRDYRAAIRRLWRALFKGGNA